MSFLKPDVPKTPAVRTPADLPPPPERTDAEVAALAETQRQRQRQGRAATILTGGMGADAGSSAVRFLGGSART